jgi:hypothetical protein
MRPRGVTALLALAGVLVAAVAAGCGSSAAGSGAGAGTLLADTFGSGGTHIRSADLNVSLRVQAKGFKSFTGPVDVRLAGPFETGKAGTAPRFDFDLRFASAGSSVVAGAVSSGTKGYLKLGGRAYVLPASSFKQLAGSGLAGKGSGFSLESLGVDVRRWVKDVKTVGEDSVAGTPTIHLTAGLDVPRLLADLDTVLGKADVLGVGNATGALPSGLSAATREKIARSIDRARVDIWTGKSDHALRRFALDVRFDVPAALLPKGSTGQSGEVALDLTLADVNRPQPIAAPANPRPLSELTAALQQLAAHAQSAAGSGSTYNACVAKAGTDLAAVQRCSGLLGQ